MLPDRLVHEYTNYTQNALYEGQKSKISIIGTSHGTCDSSNYRRATVLDSPSTFITS